MTTETATAIELPDPPSESDISSAGTVDESGIDWSEYSDEQGGDDEVVAMEGDIEVVAPPVAKAPPPPVETVPPVQEPAAQPTETPAVTPAATPTQTPQSQPVTPVSPPSPPAATPGSAPSTIPTVPVEPTLDIGKWEQEQISQLSQFYAIDEADAQSLQTEPELILPKLAANMHMAVTKSILASVQAMLPQMLAHHTQQMTVEQQARNEFFTANPDLVGQEDAVLQVGKMFRAANPTATKEQAVKVIGDMVRMSLGLPIQQAQETPPPQTPAPAVPSAPAKPFTPSKAGGAGSQIKQPNVWETFLTDD
jgi:hypothetical protein